VARLTVEDPLVGQELGPYRVLSKLGEGAMGRVYKVEHLGLQRVSALKVLPPGLVERSPEAVTRFMREARASAALDHPNIVATFNVGEEGEWHYIEMQCVEGENADDRLRKLKRLSVGEATRLVMETANALAKAHERGIVHRDIKPSNMLLDANGHVKVADFGLARITELEPVDTGPAGSACFMSPEAFKGNDVDGRSDIYSLGCTYFFLLTGVPPFRGESPVAIMRHHFKSPVPDPAQRVPGLPDEVRRIICRAMAKKPENRYQTCEDLAQALSALSEKLAAAEEPEPPPAPTPTASDIDVAAAQPPEEASRASEVEDSDYQQAIGAAKALAFKIGAVVVTIIVVLAIRSPDREPSSTSSGNAGTRTPAQDAAETAQRRAQFDLHRKAGLAHELEHEWAAAAEQYEQALRIKDDDAVRASYQTALHSRLRAEALALASKHDYASAEAKLTEAIQAKDLAETRSDLEAVRAKKSQAQAFRSVVSRAKELAAVANRAEEWDQIVDMYRAADPLPEDAAQQKALIAAAKGSRLRARVAAVVAEAEELAAQAKTTDDWHKVIAAYRQIAPLLGASSDSDATRGDAQVAAPSVVADLRKQVYALLVGHAKTFVEPCRPNEHGVITGVPPEPRRLARQMVDEALAWIPDGERALAMRGMLPHSRQVRFATTTGRLQVQTLGAGQVHELDRKAFQGKLLPGEWVAVRCLPLVLKRDFALEWDGAPQCFLRVEKRYSLWQRDSEDGPRRRVGLDARRDDGLAELKRAADSRETALTSIILKDLTHEITRAAVERLPITAVKVERAEGLEVLTTIPNLRHLDLSGASLVDLSSLRGLNGLNSLSLRACRALSDVSDIIHLTDLTTIDLSDCAKLRDLEGLETLANVTALRLRNCSRVTDLTPLSGLRNLTLLDLSGCERVLDLTPLANLPHLATLDISACSGLPRPQIEAIKGALSDCTIRE